MKPANTRPAPAATDTGLVTELAYKFWSVHPKEIDQFLVTHPIPENYKGGGRAWFFEHHMRELLAAERAEKEIAERNRDAARDNFLTMQKTAAKLLERAEKAEADNAALTTRVKELEADLKTFQDGTADLVNEKIDAEFRAIDLEAKLEAAEKSAFEHGYVLACCNIVNLHDEPTIAHCTLSELGVTRAAVKAMDLSEYDLKALRKIERDRSRSPYAKASRKARAVLGGKPS
ncbi:hypothetical protein BKD02_08390 [Brucella sp. 09RB8910]|nr:hypothetical protein BKD02_08390 [Brucella sp. 09RB8910]